MSTPSAQFFSNSPKICRLGELATPNCMKSAGIGSRWMEGLMVGCVVFSPP